MAILSKACKPDNSESHNSLKLSFANIRGLHWNFLDCKSSTGFTSLSALLVFPLGLPSSSLCTVFYSIPSNIDEVLSINPSANAFVFGDFNVHHKDWLY